MRGAFLFLAVCIPLTTSAQPVAKIPLSTCRLKGLSDAALCGTVDVPEDRAHPERRTLHLKVAVLRSFARTPAPDPLFLLAGGPGQSALDGLGVLAEKVLAPLRHDRDLVLVDQRGTGASNPLECRLAPDDAPLADRFDAGLLSPTALSECAKKWTADLSQYTTPIAMQDLDDVRAALGYDLINLWGGSYGTRAALVYLREHGQHVRSVILDGVAPLQLVLPVSMARDGDRALRLLFADCAADAACDRAFPSLAKRFDDFVAALKAAPAKITVAHPQTGVPTELTITHEAFVQSLRGQLYLPDAAALMPYTLDHIMRGDWGPFVAQNAGLEGSFVKGMYLGLLFATTCAEDLPYTSDDELENAARNTFLGSGLGHTWKKICGVFPHATPQPKFREAVRSDKPVLLLSGELDPVTPPSWAEEARRTLSSSVHLVLPGVGHGATPYGCVPKIIQRFLKAGSIASLDTSCATKTKRPPFFLTFAGPSP